MSKSTSAGRQIPDEAAVTKPSVRALCCQCGQLNTFPTDRPSPKGGLNWRGERQPVDVRAGIVPADDDTEAWARCVIQRRCPNCREHTTHALLRDEPSQYRDSLERTHRLRCEQGRRYDPEPPEGWTQWALGYCTYCRSGIAEWFADVRRWDARRGGA
ncbi:MAG: hypothetical protein ACJ74U_20065 [Jatrophihabitantaceae bacterium]